MKSTFGVKGASTMIVCAAYGEEGMVLVVKTRTRCGRRACSKYADFCEEGGTAGAFCS